MTLSQLDYIVAVDTYRHFATAAEHCHVTQPTLSMQIQKLEDELGVLIFDRSKQPVVPTETGQAILAQAREVLRAARRIPEIVQESRNEVSGELKIGIIQTLAPYLLPRFIGAFVQSYPAVAVQVEEVLTGQMLERLRNGLLDVGIAATPLPETGLTELPLFAEPFMLYATPTHPLATKPTVAPTDLTADGLWLLTEGHCFRDQVLQLCGQNTDGNARTTRFRYESGSLETLVKLIDRQDGFTLLPYLATLDLPAERRARLRPFVPPAPVRSVGLIVHRSYLKRNLIGALRQAILAHLPTELQTARSTT